MGHNTSNVTRGIGAFSVRLRRVMTKAAIAGLILRALIPLGYMPGNIFAGEFMVLCPSGVPASFTMALGHHHHGQDTTAVDADQTCPIGTALQHAWLPQAHIEFSIEVPQLDIVAIEIASVNSASTQRFYSPRAPPLI